jgi:ADP-heptose:LPS heptosyltransferase/predicted SAM-dependent methyltransferase
MWRADDPQGDEAGKIKYLAVPYTRGIVLDMGCGPKKAFPHFLGVDSCKDTELFGIAIKPDVNLDVSDPAAIAENIVAESVDAVFSSHCLEHIADYRAALKAWWDCIKVGGHLVLYLPHAAFYPNIGTAGANPDHVHDFMPDTIVDAMVENDARFDLLVDEERDQDCEYSFYQVYRKLGGEDERRYNGDNERPPKTACVVRYGGFGDQIQASGILPELKRQGYHVTVMTTPKGQNILAHDPHIDEWILQDVDQVPNHELWIYWQAWEKRFDRFVNLSESVEGTLLAIPGRANHMWSAEMRHRKLNKNYGEWTAELADLPYENAARFYATPEETAAARELIELAFGRHKFVIVWALAGSSGHKTYPYLDNVLAGLMNEIPDARVILVGDAACALLEQGWEDEKRIARLSGTQSIRETLALAQVADCVVGPETGVLNAVAFDPMRKVVFLSHSSHENLTKHWINTVALAAHEKTTCATPCHRMHYSDEFCNTDGQFNIAMCMAEINPADCFDAIASAYRTWRSAQVRLILPGDDLAQRPEIEVQYVGDAR